MSFVSGKMGMCYPCRLVLLKIQARPVVQIPSLVENTVPKGSSLPPEN